MKRREFLHRSATAALGLGMSAGLGACAASARGTPASPTGPAPAALVRALPKVELHAHLEGTDDERQALVTRFEGEFENPRRQCGLPPRQ